MHYLDHCGSTPVAPEVESTIIEFVKSGNFGNPSAAHHAAGSRAFELVETCRESIARDLGAKPSQIIFTSGASEANNLLLWGFALRYRARGCHILFGATEHKSIFDTATALTDLEGVTSSCIPVNSNGTADLNHLELALQGLQNKSVLVALMHINNEVPVRHPVEEISKICRKYGAFFHCDGVQGFVREPLDFSQGLFGSYVLSSHKIYGLKGFGVLVLGDGLLSTRISPPYHGGGHERGMRPGTLNTLAIAAGATSISLHNKKRKERLAHMNSCAKAFIDRLQRELPEMRLTLPMNDLAVGIMNFYVPGIDAPTLLAAMPDICINRGASCIGSGGETFSHVPKALGFPIEIQANVLRASFGEAISVQGSQEAAVLISQRTKNLR